MKEESKERKFAVVYKLPEVQTRIGVDEKNEEYDFVTIEEAVQEILETVRELKKKL